MLKGYKTIAFNVIMSVIMIVNLWNPGAELPDEGTIGGVLDTADAAITGIWAAGNLILRAITNSTIFKDTSPAPAPPMGPM